MQLLFRIIAEQFRQPIFRIGTSLAVAAAFFTTVMLTSSAQTQELQFLSQAQTEIAESNIRGLIVKWREGEESCILARLAGCPETDSTDSPDDTDQNGNLAPLALEPLNSQGIEINTRRFLLGAHESQHNTEPLQSTTPAVQPEGTIDDAAALQPVSANRLIQRDASLSRVELLQFASAEDTSTAIAILNSHPAVEYVEPDYLVRANGMPSANTPLMEHANLLQAADDTLYVDQWSLRNTGQNEGTAGADVNIEFAWQLTQGSTNTVVAILDSGIDLTHPDLAAKLVAGHDFINNDNDPENPEHDGPNDDYGVGHGTHVAGIVGAITNNGLGVAGVCPQCRLMPIKVLDSQGTGTVGIVVSGLDFAIQNGAHVINASLEAVSYSITLRDVVKAAYDAKIPLVSPMGNSGVNERRYPAALDEVIAVGSTDKNDQWSEFSNYGSWIDLVAPGDGVLSTARQGNYAFFTGTSMAAPHIAGVLGLLHGLNPNLTVEEQRALLRASTGNSVSAAAVMNNGFDDYYGAGRLNAGAVVELVEATPIEELIFSGPVTGLPEQRYLWQVQASPAAASLPVVYQWTFREDGQPKSITATGGLTSTISFEWTSSGMKEIIVKATNAGGSIERTLLVEIEVPEPAPIDVVPTEPAPTEPVPTEPVPTEPVPTTVVPATFTPTPLPTYTLTMVPMSTPTELPTAAATVAATTIISNTPAASPTIASTVEETQTAPEATGTVTFESTDSPELPASVTPTAAVPVASATPPSTPVVLDGDPAATPTATATPVVVQVEVTPLPTTELPNGATPVDAPTQVAGTTASPTPASPTTASPTTQPQGTDSPTITPESATVPVDQSITPTITPEPTTSGLGDNTGDGNNEVEGGRVEGMMPQLYMPLFMN